MNLTTFQAAIQAQVKAMTGLNDGHVIWADQTRTRPTRPFIELGILDSTGTENTESSSEDNPAPVAGSEILLNTREDVTLTVQLIAFSRDIVGSSNAFNLLQTVRFAFGHDSVSEALGDIAVVDRGPVRNATIVLETEHEGRAICALQFRVANLDVETATYIETATVRTTVAQTGDDVVRTITVSKEE